MSRGRRVGAEAEMMATLISICDKRRIFSMIRNTELQVVP